LLQSLKISEKNISFCFFSKFKTYRSYYKRVKEKQIFNYRFSATPFGSL